MKQFYRYIPLFVLVSIAFLAATALTIVIASDIFVWMHFFMGIAFCQFAMLKLFHLKGFVEGFLKYDWLAQKFSWYGYLYPFIELALGLAYLSFFAPYLTYIVTIIVMGAGTFSVIRALKKGLKVKCACMGTILDVPLSTVTLSEDIAAIVMALIMLIL